MKNQAGHVTWYAEFADPTLENEYFSVQMVSIFNQVRIVILVLGLLYGSLSLFDFRTLGEHGPLAATVRSVSMLVAVAIFFLSKYLKNKEYIIPICAAVILGTFLSYLFLINVVQTSRFILQTFSVTAMVVALYLIPAKWKQVVMLSVAMALSYFIFCYLTEDLSPAETAIPFGLMALIVVIAASSLQRFEVIKRKQYFENKELETLTNGLEDLVARRTAELETKTREAVEASLSKSQFLSRMSHEMRTPMNAIIGMVKVSDNTDDVGRLRYCLDTIGVSADHLLNLINDILDMSKIEAGKLELDNHVFNLEKMLMKTCNLIVDKTDKKEQRFTINLSPTMHMHYIGDELRLSQVLTNLLSNAVKFTPQQGAISLDVKERELGSDRSLLSFRVLDTGIGMSKEQMARLFQSFEQADGSISRRYGGTGLGLSISQSIVEKMGGKIIVRSKEGKGTIFSFDVEFPRPENAPAHVIFDQISPEDLNILVVDHDPGLRKHFSEITGGFGIHTDRASSGSELIELLGKPNPRPYDVIFLDYHLPDMDMVELMHRLADRIDKNTVVVMTTFLEWGNIEDEARKAGIERCITKPLFPSSILNTICEVVGTTMKGLDLASERKRNLPDFSKGSLLLVEDVEINQEIFISLLEETGVQIDVASNGLEALHMFGRNPDKYDVIVMDIQMPQMDGYEATRRIRALEHPNARRVPIVAMTANAFKEDVEKCLACGMDDHLSKPIDETRVMEKLGLYLKKPE